MPSPTADYQNYVCPEEFQARLTDIGGINPYDEPNFRLVWSQGGDEYALYRAGGAWEVEGMPSYRGYRDLLKGGGTPSWALMQWHPAVQYGTPESYYVQNYDQDTGLQDLGEYPYSGRYEILYNLRWSERRNNRLHFEAMPLNTFLLNTVVPIIIQAKDISWEKTKAALLDQKAKEDKEDVNKIEEVMHSSKVPFGGNPVSYTRQGCRTSLIDKKIEQMTRNWNMIMQNAKSLGKGLGAPGIDSSVVQAELRKKTTN
jgi:hypothetical protein